MALIKVLIIFVVILALLNKRLPLYLAMIFGSLLMIVMFRLPIATAGQTALHTITGWDVWSVNLAMYVISVLVYELDLRHRFEDAQRAMNGLMRDPRLNTSLACMFIGLMQGPATVTICGGMVDTVMQRIVELIYSIPEMLIILLLSATLKPALEQFQNSGDGVFQKLVTLLGPNLISMFIAFGLLYWVTMSRIIRGQVLQLKQQEYVTAARALGAKGGRIISKHLLPNCIGQIVVTTCLQIPSAIFLESFLSYLGVGVSAPLPSLGSMATDALSGMYTYTYRLIVPSVILSIMILAFNLFGDGLRDALDPKLKN